ELFAKHGFSGTTTRLISDTANANIAMISYYFGGKEKLLKAILDRFADDIYVLVKKIEEKEKDPKERLKSWLMSYLEYVFEHPNPINIANLQLNLVTDKPDLFISTRQAFDKIIGLVYSTLEEGKESGVFQPIDIELTVISLKSTIENMVLQSELIKQDFNIEPADDDILFPESFRNRVKEHILSLLQSHVFKHSK
ncbi:MAG: TetR family transcriptional regulator, partial [Balneolales bacterium]